MTKGQFKIFRCLEPGIQAVAAATRHAFARHWHEQYGIGVIHQGAHKSASGRGMVEAGAGDIITVNPGEVHDGAPVGDSGRSWSMLYFEPSIVLSAFAEMSEGGRHGREFPSPVVNDARAAAMFGQLFETMTGSGDGASGMNEGSSGMNEGSSGMNEGSSGMNEGSSGMNESTSGMRGEELLLALLARTAREGGAAAAQRRAPAAIGRAKSRIDDAPAAAITLADLACETGLSRFQVLRGFVRATGFTPHAYLTQRRIDLARRLIARRVPLAEAAAACGFADQSHMTRTFVRKYGVSPGAYAAVFA
jgi:AraC-like DNA-binding protein